MLQRDDLNVYIFILTDTVDAVAVASAAALFVLGLTPARNN